VAFEVQFGEHTLVAERPEHHPLGTGHVERGQPLVLDTVEQLLGGFGSGFGLEDYDH
jgi:hypothetical protein